MARTITASPVVKSIQRGTISIAAASASQTATISSVDTSKAELRFLGHDLSGGPARVTLTNATTITANRQSVSGDTSVSWELTEYT